MSSRLNHREVEKFLIDNPEFLKSWLKIHGTPELYSYKSGSQSEPSSPEFKIKRLPKFDGPGNSITQSIFKKYVEGNLSRLKKTSQDRQALLSMSEEEVFMELIRDIATELDVNVLCHKILKNVSILTRSDRGSLFLVRGVKDQRYLVSKLFDVTEVSVMEETLHTEDTEIKVPFGVGIAGHVAQTKETVNIKDAYQDPRFNKEVDLKTGYTTHSILCMPILNYYGEVIGVAQIINKVTGNHEFTKADEEVFRRYLIFCGIGITNAQLFEMSVQEYQRNQLLLSLARGVFEEQQSLERLVQKIMMDAQGILKCERCSVYLLEGSISGEENRFTGMFAKIVKQYNYKQLAWSILKDPIGEQKKLEEPKKAKSTKEVLFSRAFDLYAKDGKNIHIPSDAEVARSQNAEIARHVVVHGKPLNLSHDQLMEKLGKGPFSEENGFKTQNVLSMPIFNSDKNIIGVMQLINKSKGAFFNESDANIMEAFSIFTGLGIHNCQMYENACKLMAKQTVALEVLSYHACAQAEETEKLMNSKFPSGEEAGLYSFSFNDMTMGDDDTVRCVITMFTEANLINTFRIPLDVICRWTLSVKKNYRPVTYHNWRHAFNVFQTMFTMINSGGMLSKFNELETLSLLVACLCHDLDHRGTNNDFQVKVASPLAMLYSTSVMEHHHFDHCIMILNSEGNNIFQSLSSDDYRNAIRMLEHAILSTDLALYFKKRGEFKKLVDAGETEYQEPFKKDLLKAMMMTACDVAAITKPWEIQKEVAQLVANEFFEQGDIEKSKLGKVPIAMMDREKKDDLPKMQVGFIDAICLPIYETLSDQWRGLVPMLEGCLKNRQKWKKLADAKSSEEVNCQEEGNSSKNHSSIRKPDRDEMSKQGKRKDLNDSPTKNKPKTVTLNVPKKTSICTLL